MKEIQDYEKDIASIRTIMERSAKFISLSGMSGVMAGIYAIAGAAVAYYTTVYPSSIFRYRIHSIQRPEIIWQLLIIAVCVLIASLTTGLLLSQRKAKKHGITLWSPASRRLLLNMAIPLVTGGIFILILLSTGHFGVAAPACLIFYGLSLIHGSSNTYDEVRYLGYSEIVLGLISATLPGFGLLFWTLGFGILHILYGAIMYNKYDR